MQRHGLGGAVPLGGMARSHGVVIVSEHYWAYAGVDGSVKEGEMPHTPRALRAVPLARGLVRLAASLSPLFKRTGVAQRRERWFLAVAILAPLGLVFAPEWVGLSVGGLTTFALLGWLLRGRTLYLHGAEHRAIAAAEAGSLAATWAGEARPTRFSARCGTNFAALAIPITAVIDQLVPRFLAPTLTGALVAVFSIGVSMELWKAVQHPSGLLRGFLLPGLALQRLTTREPRLDDTQVALRAVAAVLRRELS